MSNTTPTRIRNPLKEIPSSLSIRSPVSADTVSSCSKLDMNNANYFVDIPEEKENTTKGYAMDKYSSIGALDDELEDVKWLERNTIITSIDHIGNTDAAAAIIESIIDQVVNKSGSRSLIDCCSVSTSCAVSNMKSSVLSSNVLREAPFPTDSSVDTSFSSVSELKESDSEYESAVESIVSETVTDLMNKMFDNVEIGEGGDMMDKLKNAMIEDEGQDTTITYTSPRKDDLVIEGETVTPVAKPSRFPKLYRDYRGSQEEEFTPDRRFQGGAGLSSGLALLDTPASTEKGGRRQTLGSFIRLFQQD